jgi:polysaccharide biosynthesis protein PslJ
MSAGDAVVGLPPRRMRERADGAGAETRTEATAVADRVDAWPHTTRVLPWLLAAFLVMLWLVPFDSASLPVNLPFESKLDRVVIIVIAFVWLAALLVGGRSMPKLRSSPLNWAVGGFLVAAVTSILVNASQLVNLDELSLSVKKLALLLGYVLFYFLVTSILRPSEVRAFVTLVIGLACITAIGTIVEYRTGFNVFFDWGAKILGPVGLALDPQPPDDPFGRASITGPTQHGLVVALMLTIAFALCLTRLVEPTQRRRWLVAVAAIIILAGAFATQRKSALVVPVAVVGAMVAIRPRQAMRLAPVGVAMALAMPIVAPGALGSIRNQLFTSDVAQSNSTTGRTQDYAAVKPDVAAHPTFGRGYGSYDPHKYRIIDNQYIGLAIETGFVGVAAYLLLLLGVVVAARPAMRSGDPDRGPPALAAACAAVAVGVAAALFDVFAYPQVPYLFLFAAALAVVCSASVRGESA